MIEITHLIGISLALIAATGLGAQVVLIRKGTDTGRATDAVLVVTLVNLAFLIPTTAIIYYPNYGLTWYSTLSFIGAGIAGTLFGRVFKYTSIERIGASRTAPIVASNAVFGALIAVVVLDEVLTLVHFLAIILIVGGVAAISWETSQDNPQNLSQKQLLLGLTLPFAAAVFYGTEPTLAKAGIDSGTPFLVGLLVKTVAAIIGFTFYLRYSGMLPTYTDLQTVNTKWYIGAGLGNTLFVVCLYAGLSVAPVTIVYPIIPTNILFVLLLSAIFLPNRLETITWRLVIASMVIVLGVIIITLYT